MQPSSDGLLSSNDRRAPHGRPAIAVSDHVRWPVIRDEDRAAVSRVLDRGVLSGSFAPETVALEREFAAYVGARHCLATNSGTAALHLALAALGVGPGDEVIVPAFTFVATALAVMHQGAKPVFVDIEPAAWGMDPQGFEKAITSRTKAVVPVHIHGTPCELDAILAVARRHGIPVIEDACQAHGAEYRGRKVGTFGRMAAFSLQSSKNVACGEGGLLVSDDEELSAHACRARAFGEDMSPTSAAEYRIDRPLDSDRAYDSVTVGWMYRTTELSAALARSQLRDVDRWNAAARRNAEILSSRLGELPGVIPPRVAPDRVSVFHKYRVRLDATRAGIQAPPTQVRDALVKALRAEGVDAVLWQTKPVPGQRLFAGAGYDSSCFPETTRLLDSSLCLFSQTFPIAPQPAELCEAYAEAFARVWGRLDTLL